MPQNRGSSQAFQILEDQWASDYLTNQNVPVIKSDETDHQELSNLADQILGK